MQHIKTGGAARGCGTELIFCWRERARGVFKSAFCSPHKGALLGCVCLIISCANISLIKRSPLQSAPMGEQAGRGCLCNTLDPEGVPVAYLSSSIRAVNSPIKSSARFNDLPPDYAYNCSLPCRVVSTNPKQNNDHQHDARQNLQLRQFIPRRDRKREEALSVMRGMLSHSRKLSRRWDASINI